MTATPYTSTHTPTRTGASFNGKISDGALLRAAEAGDRAAWEELVARHTGLLWSLARSYQLDEADSADVVQATYLRLTQYGHRLGDPESVTIWLAATARAQCLTRLRSRRRKQPTPAEAPDRASHAVEPDGRAMAADWTDRMRAALARLPDRDARLLRTLVTRPNPGYAAIAAGLGMPAGSIGPTRARALARLRAELAADLTRQAGSA